MSVSEEAAVSSLPPGCCDTDPDTASNRVTRLERRGLLGFVRMILFGLLDSLCVMSKDYDY